MSCLDFQTRGFLIAAVTVLAVLLSPANAWPSKRAATTCQWGMKSRRIGLAPASLSHWDVLESLRAGATIEEDEEEEEDEDEVGVQEEVDEVSDDEDEEYDEEESSSDEDESEYESAVEEEEVSISVEEYDIQLTPPPGLQIGSLLVVMLLSRRLDMFSPKVVRFARYDSRNVLFCNKKNCDESYVVSHSLFADSYSSFTLLRNKCFWYTFESQQSRTMIEEKLM